MSQRPYTHRKPKRQSISFEARLRIFCTVGALVLLGLSTALLAMFHVTTGPMLATLGILLLVLLLVFGSIQEVGPVLIGGVRVLSLVVLGFVRSGCRSL